MWLGNFLNRYSNLNLYYSATSWTSYDFPVSVWLVVRSYLNTYLMGQKKHMETNR